MLADTRRSAIVDAVERERVVSVAALAKMFNVSLMTVRRDIDALEDAGLLEKIHGGAKIHTGVSTHEPGFDLKSTQGQGEKHAIAREAAKMVKPGMAIGLSAGTTTWVLAKYLTAVPDLTVVTNSVHISEVFRAAKAATTVILTGGERTPSDALVGTIAVASIRQLHMDLLFLGVHGVDAVAGFTTPNLQEADTDRALIAASRRVVVLADESKWGVLGISTIAGLDDVDEVISDSGLAPEAQRVLGQHLRLRLVEVPGSAG
ncbi:DeoR/GlpR family DNA-binding transcription regulator [Pseudarthrobacter sp. P1]|uniref:DeoR/GlpR family DNA-binding transcription regulator n=1 Tax=Pseudarthrobacter sp. P1 TaxID=3418418 RepID=UPI003CFADDBC